MVMNSLREGAKTGITKYFLLGFLVLAAGGLVLTDVGGFFRGGVGGNDVGRAGKEKIGVVAFDRSVRRSLAQIGIDTQEAYKLGYINEILNNEIRASILQQSARDTGIILGREALAEHINSLIEPLVGPGQNRQDVLDDLLFRQGMSEGEFLRVVSRELGANVLTRGIHGGFAAPSPLMQADLAAYDAEKRDIAYVAFLDKDMKADAAPNDNVLNIFYEAQKNAYAVPERRSLKIITVDQSKLRDTLEITDEELRVEYDDNIDAYLTPETRTVEQAVLSSQEDAQSVADKVKAGSALEKAVTDITDEALAYLGDGDFEEAVMLDELKRPVFDASKNDVVGPVQSALGWHVMILKDIKAETTRAFSDVRKDLKEEFVQVKLADQIYELAGQVDDLFAGGASVDEVVDQADVKITNITAIDSAGLGKDKKDALANYEIAKELILETAFNLEEGEVSPVVESSDGEFFAVQLSTLSPRSFKPLSDVRAEVLKRWNDTQRRVKGKQKASVLMEEIVAADASIAQKAPRFKTLKGIKRKSEKTAPFSSASAINILFGLEIGKLRVIDIDGGVALATVTKVDFPENAKADEEAQAQLLSSMKNEAIALYLENRTRKYGAAVNERLLQSVYGQAAQH